jgi:hypothetical protein
MKLVWSLANRNPQHPHNQYVYDMFYLSVHLAKDLGYQTVLYGTTDAIVRIGEYFDETHNTDNIEYVLFDDLKIHIWEMRTDDYATIDGDMFLYSPIEFNTNPSIFLSFEQLIKNDIPNSVTDSLKLLNQFDITTLIPEWDISSKNSISTNLIRWKGNNGLLKYYIECYKNLRKLFLDNEDIVKKHNSELVNNKSLISHILCEHLLERLVIYYNLSYDEIKTNPKNSYSHWQGSEKFENKYKINSVKLIVESHKLIGGTIKSVYNSLITQKIIEPILYD